MTNNLFGICIFVGYLTTLSAAQIVLAMNMGWLTTDELQKVWKETFPEFLWRGWWKPWKSSARTAGVSGEIRTQHLSNTSADSYHYIATYLALHFGNELSRGGVTTGGIWIDYWTLWHSAWLHFTVHCYTHIAVPAATSSLSLLGSGFQRRTFPFLWVPELSRPQLPASNSNSSQQLNLNSPLTHWLHWLVLLITSRHEPLLLLTGSSQVTAVIQLLISRPLFSNESICHSTFIMW
jgi:hypothetical protein